MRTMRLLLPVLLPCLPLSAQAPTSTAKPQEPARLTVGKPAPAFRLNDDTGTATRVGGTAKTWTVLAFYPKASTGG